MGPGHSNWGALMGGLKNLSGGYLAPAMLRQRMGGAGIRLHSTLLKRSPMTVRLAASDSGAQQAPHRRSASDDETARPFSRIAARCVDYRLLLLGYAAHIAATLLVL